MLEPRLACMAAVRVFSRHRYDTAVEIITLRQQTAVPKRRQPRPTLKSSDRRADALTRPAQAQYYR